MMHEGAKAVRERRRRVAYEGSVSAAACCVFHTTTARSSSRSKRGRTLSHKRTGRSEVEKNRLRNPPVATEMQHGGFMRSPTTGKAPSRFVEALCSGMPSSYWLHHEHDAIREHADGATRQGRLTDRASLR